MKICENDIVTLEKYSKRGIATISGFFHVLHSGLGLAIH
jgi:hypothetical protein